MISASDLPSASPLKCGICFDIIPAKNDYYECPNLNTSCCIPCFIDYIDNKINSAYYGTCPLLTCPLCVSTSTSKCLLSDDIISKYSSTSYRRYIKLLQSVLSIQCSSCHNRGSLYFDTSLESYTNLIDTDDDILTVLTTTNNQFLNDLIFYNLGRLSISTFYELLTTTYFPCLIHSNDDDSWKIMKKILLLILNSERRVNLYLKYLQYHSCIHTLCCKRKMCFQCKTQDYHTGYTCSQYINNHYKNDIVKCSQCSLQLVKGDGCDRITCVCGKSFSWSEEIQNIHQAKEFSSKYSKNTAYYCVEILCSPLNYDTSLVTLATAWNNVNQELFQKELLSWWFRSFGLASTQITLPIIQIISNKSNPINLTRNSIIDGNSTLQRASNLWKYLYKDQYERCKQSRDFCNSSYFQTLFPTNQDRFLLISQILLNDYLLLCRRDGIQHSHPSIEEIPLIIPLDSPLIRECSSHDQQHIINEANIWYRRNKKNLCHTISQLLHNRAKCFLSKFGHRFITFHEATKNTSCGIPCDKRIKSRLFGNEIVKLQGATTLSTVVRHYPEDLILLIHDTKKHGMYPLHRIVQPTYMIPFPDLSEQILDDFICYLLLIKQSLHSSLAEKSHSSSIYQLFESGNYLEMVTMKCDLTWQELFSSVVVVAK